MISHSQRSIDECSIDLPCYTVIEKGGFPISSGIDNAITHRSKSLLSYLLYFEISREREDVCKHVYST